MPTGAEWFVHLLRSLIHIRRRDVPWQVALRNTAGVVAPLLAGLYSGHLGAGVGIAVGALVVMFADQPGAYRDRLRRMLLTSVAGGLSALAGYSLGGHPILMLVATAVWTLCGSMLVALGPSAARAGLTSVILLLITGAGTDAGGASPWIAAGLIASGGVLQSLLAVAAWPLQRYRPERLALADAFVALATAARQTSASDALPPISDNINNLLILLHGDGRPHGRAMEAFYVLVAELERMRLEIVALEDQRSLLEAGDASSLRELADAAAAVLEQLAQALREARLPDAATQRMAAYQEALGVLRQRAAQSIDAGSPLSVVVVRGHALGAQLRAAIRNVDFAGSRGEIRATVDERRMPRALRQSQPWAVLRANIHLHSIAMRHALRSAICVVSALALARFAGSEHAYWMPMTVAIVLKPDFGATMNYGLLRVAGTLAGLLLTSMVLQWILGGNASRIALLAVLCFTYRQVAPMHYGLGVTALTGMLVILLAFAGDPAAQVMWARGVFTVAGCAFALAAYGMWPTWERRRVREALAHLFDCYHRYLHSLNMQGNGDRADARAAARSARSNAQASLERLRHEPAQARELLGAGTALFANGSRLARVAMTLEATLSDAQNMPAAAQLQRCLDTASTLAKAIAYAIRNASSAPDASAMQRDAHALRDALQHVAGTDPEYVTAVALTQLADRLDDIFATLIFVLSSDDRLARKTITLGNEH